MVDLAHTFSASRCQGKSVRVLRSVLILVALALAVLSLARSCALSRRLDALAQPPPVSLTVYRHESWHAEPIEPRQITKRKPH